MNPYCAPASECRRSDIATLSLWNPGATVVWSLIFSPVFGAILQMKNWHTLGEHAKAAKAKIWSMAMAAVGVSLVLGMAMLVVLIRSMIR